MQLRPMLLFFLLLSCSDKHRSIYLRTDNAEGITKRSVVSIKGFPIGQVRNIVLGENGQFFVRLELDEGPAIPGDSKFRLEQQSFLGASDISVDLGTQTTPISEGDTILLMSPAKASMTDSLTTALQDIFDSLTGTKQRDSILQELRRLNKNLEDLKKE